MVHVHRGAPGPIDRGRRGYAGPAGPLVALPYGAARHWLGLELLCAVPVSRPGRPTPPTTGVAAAETSRVTPGELADRLGLGRPLLTLHTDVRKCLALLGVSAPVGFVAGEVMWRFDAVLTALAGVVLLLCAVLGVVAGWALIDGTEVHVFESGVLTIARSGTVRAQFTGEQEG